MCCPRTDRIESLVVNAAQLLAPVDVLPDPLGKLLLDELLPVLGDGGFLLVQYRLFVAVIVIDIVKDADIFLV